MTQVNSVNSFEGKQKYSNYDLKQAEKVAVLSMVGDKAGAKEAFDEFAKDKKLDKIRGLAISAATLVGAIALRRATGGKITKKLAQFGDVVADWFRKGADDGRKVVSEFLEKDIKQSSKLKNGVKKVLHKLIKNEDYYNKVANFLKDKADWVYKKVAINKVKDVAELGVATAIGLKVDEPFKNMADRADEGRDINKKLAESEEV